MLIFIIRFLLKIIIENWSGNLNEVLINDQDPVSVNDTVDESIGNIFQQVN